jgi:hypothetical protein
LNEQLFGSHGFPWESVDLARVALDELLRREGAGHLPDRDRNAIVELGLGVQQSWPNLSPVQYHLLDYLNDRILAGDLSAEQLDRFYRPALAEKLSVRPVVFAGEDVPIRVGMDRAWACGGNWLVEYTYQSAQVDQQPATLSPPPPPSVRAAEYGSQDQPDERTVPCPPIGHHVLNLTLLVKVRYGHHTFPEHGPVMRSVTLNLSTPFEVAAPSAENAIKLIADPSLIPKLRAAAVTSQFQYSNSDSWDLFGVLEMAPLPMNIAFDVFAQYGGHQYPIGHFIQSAGGVGHYIWCKSQRHVLPKPPPTIDIVLRSSPKAARTTLDLYRIWNGEIVLREVPVKDASR